ncbi:hypothetical protein ES703_56869 [subsurface metagenome]
MAGWTKRSCRAKLSSMRKQHWRTTTGYGRARARMPTGSALLTDCPNRFSSKSNRVAAGIQRWTSQGAELVFVPIAGAIGSHRPGQVAVWLRMAAPRPVRPCSTANLVSPTASLLSVRPLSWGNLCPFAPQGIPMPRRPQLFRHFCSADQKGRLILKVRLKYVPSVRGCSK